MSELSDLVSAIVAGDLRLTADEVRALIAQGHTREELLDALVAAASTGASSRRIHHALSVLRDVRL